MKLIVGLGNPGKKYENTRHNVGFLLLDQLCEDLKYTDFLYQKKFQAETATGLFAKRQVIAAKPQTFMNKSGQSIQAIMQYYKISQEDILIIHDDIDLPMGKTKLKYAGSHGGHNGIRDTIRALGTQDFRRLKIGVGRPAHADHYVSDYVLGSFGDEDMHRVHTATHEIHEKVHAYMKNTG